MSPLRILLLVSLISAGCGSDNSAASMGTLSGPLLPWAAGNTWTYRVTDKGTTENWVMTVGAVEPVGGAGPTSGSLANRLTILKGTNDHTLRWLAVVGNAVVRYREETFKAKTGEANGDTYWSPYRLEADSAPEHTTMGATWVDSYEETSVPPGGQANTSKSKDRWTVTAENESITVPAGTFNAVVLQKSGGKSVKTYWFAHGVGMVKESDGQQVQELVSYKVSAGSAADAGGLSGDGPPVGPPSPDAAASDVPFPGTDAGAAAGEAGMEDAAPDGRVETGVSD